MSMSPKAWKKVVTDHYGSIAAFPDRFTVETMRGRIAARRGELKTLLDLEQTHPEALSKLDLEQLRAEDTEIAGIDQELVDWQEAHKAPVFVD